ncbi:MAG: hypothetical protein A2174_03420 [Candidatus Portnoybacteria bacterium RBG_13_41_18]|uniref:Uncharacterized protein n=1 Tax=Candidatus Portnoybacteria bacterium RBG_13_41_18 TaxID=1801991 RepID=A0A1G2F4R2_9BACT|nr:MAG: hypothetical protein A2174_03420 [Candidatus Portnoybacteria bacterium RBG_13_41_18]
MKKILISLMTIGVVAGMVVIGGTTAFFSDTETSTGNTFTAGALDLSIDNSSYLNGVFNAATSWLLANDLTGKLFFDFHDLKPGDWGEDTISLHTENDAWACMEIDITGNDDNGINEPEADDGDVTNGAGNGELQNFVSFVWWADDGDNVLEEDENDNVFFTENLISALDGLKVTLADSQGGIFGPGSLDGDLTYYIGKAWCFGDFTLSPVTQDGPVQIGLNGFPLNGPDVRNSGIVCDGSQLDNITQTDSVMANISFSAVQSRNNPNFLCAPIECEEIWAESVESNVQGTRKNGSAVLATRTDPTQALVAQTTGADYDSVTEGTFYSLGFNIGNLEGGSIVVDFGSPIYPVAGANNDIQIFEVTGGTVYPDETVKVEASQNAGGPWTLLSAAAIRDEALDISPLPWARFIQITDVSIIGDYEDIADAYDLDGVKAFCRNSLIPI